MGHYTCFLAAQTSCLNKERWSKQRFACQRTGSACLHCSSSLLLSLSCRMEGRAQSTRVPADTVPGFNDLGIIQLGWRTCHLSKQHPGWHSTLCFHMRHHVIDESGREFFLLGPNVKSFVHVTATRKKERNTLNKEGTKFLLLDTASKTQHLCPGYTEKYKKAAVTSHSYFPEYVKISTTCFTSRTFGLFQLPALMVTVQISYQS